MVLPLRQKANVLSPLEGLDGGHGADAEDARVAAGDGRVERDDRVGLQAQQTHVPHVPVAVADPHVALAPAVHPVDRSRARKL